jgi:hypothetical protein
MSEAHELSVVEFVKRAYDRIGAHFFPLESFDEAIVLMEAGLAVPPGIPSRGDRMLRLPGVVASRLASFAAGTIEALAARIGISEPAQAWLGRHPTPPEFTLLTDLESCVACGGSLSLATNQSVPNSTVVVVYSATGVWHWTLPVCDDAPRRVACHVLGQVSAAGGPPRWIWAAAGPCGGGGPSSPAP